MKPIRGPIYPCLLGTEPLMVEDAVAIVASVV